MVQDAESIEAFGFVGETTAGPASFVAAAAGLSGVRFAARVIGNHVAFVAVTADGLASLQDAMLPAVHEAGGREVRWSVARGEERAKLGRPPKTFVAPTGALVRIRTIDPLTALAALDERLGWLNEHNLEEEGFGMGAVRVFGGEVNLILDIGAPNLKALAEALTSLDDLPSARAVDVSLACFEGNAQSTGD